MGQKMTWEEMKKAYPDEWLLITDYETDRYGGVEVGLVERHGKDMKEISLPPLEDKDTAFLYTGESTFTGIRSHVEYDN